MSTLRYKIVRGYDDDHLAALVNSHLDAGYRLVGGVSAVYYGASLYCYQAMLKTEPAPADGAQGSAEGEEK